MAATDYFEKLVLDHAIRGQQFSISNWYVGLWIADPTASGLLDDEVSAADYERKLVSWASDNTNDTQIYWDAALNDWGVVTYICLLNNATKGAGNMLAYEARASLDINPGQPVAIPVGGLTIALI